jgi:hypothetical protein
MNSNYNQTELLLMINTRFFSKQLQKANRVDARDWHSKKDGLAAEMLPECFTKDSQAELWEILDGNTYIDLEFCEGRIKKDKEHSVNPYVFMQVQGLN